MPRDRPSALTASAIVRMTSSGALTAEAEVRDCLARIAERETTVRAWAALDPELALREAQALDRAAAKGPLQGVPVGVKDIIDTADLPTEMGSSIYRGHRPAADAACVALLRAAGAVILGKTVTAEFAGMTPGPTTNPHDPAHTPGGSSSGSGAAVADGMVPVALGTQTGGSVLRPASYCGIVGFKPSFGLLNRAGVKPAAESLDTMGVLARSVDDIALIAGALAGWPASPTSESAAPPRIGLCRTYLWPTALPETVAAVEQAAQRLAAVGASLREVALPPSFAGLTEAREVINCWERARAMAFEWRHHRDRISARLGAAIERGFAMDFATYLAALRLAENYRAQLEPVFAGFDVLLAPCVAGEAPAGLDSTGDHRFQGLWTLLHVPTMSLPTHRGPKGLPVGIQLVAPRYADQRLIAASHWIWQKLEGEG
ncbi:MAG TPA: amidase [Stellaceae bacterium]|nr:amidase [Stellaceae bacterium]